MEVQRHLTSTAVIRTLLFDFGNVIAFFDHQRAVRQLLPHTDRSADELVRLVYANNLEDRYESGEVTTEEVFAVGQQAGGLRCTLAQFVAAFGDIFWPNPPMADLVPRLKQAGYRLVLASNTNPAHYARYREQFRDILAHFDAIAVSHEVRSRKPHARFFEHAHRMAMCDRSECVFVDDLAENVSAAREFGWQGIHYTRFDELMSELRKLGVRVE